MPTTAEFSAELVVEKVFAYDGCDDGKYDWLATVGLDRETVDKIRRRPFKDGDIVKAVLSTGPGLTVGRLYTVEKDESPYLTGGARTPDGSPRVKVRCDDGLRRRFAVSTFELVQAVDA